MNQEDTLEFIHSEKPKVIYLSGKTSTGKTTFGKRLVDTQGYLHIELDKIVQQSVIQPFKVQDIPLAFITVYRNGEPGQWRESFIIATQQAIHSGLKSTSVVVEGAVANPDTLKRIFGSQPFTFLYLHPSEVEEYTSRIAERFINGIHNDTTALPKSFWTYLKADDIDAYKNTRVMSETLIENISKFAADSIEESARRLKNFQKAFEEITVIDI